MSGYGLVGWPGAGGIQLKLWRKWEVVGKGLGSPPWKE